MWNAWRQILKRRNHKAVVRDAVFSVTTDKKSAPGRYLASIGESIKKALKGIRDVTSLWLPHYHLTTSFEMIKPVSHHNWSRKYDEVHDSITLSCDTALTWRLKSKLVFLASLQIRFCSRLLQVTTMTLISRLQLRQNCRPYEMEQCGEKPGILESPVTNIHFGSLRKYISNILHNRWPS
jgi:hypothetical protein